MRLSVIICTHNPREDYLRLTLEALKVQSLTKDQWELLLIDNASQEPLAARWDLGWHPNARHVRENELGLTAARLRGFKEAQSEDLVFVDDDNVLAPDYLAEAGRISADFPRLGVWAGSITGVYEIEPPAFLAPHLGLLAVGEIKSDSWGNQKGFNAACPVGAGMVVRKQLAMAFHTVADHNPMRRLLGRKGNQLTCGEEVDLAWSICEMGFGMGRFTRMKLHHHIAARRLNLDYFERLIEGGEYSNVFLKYLHPGVIQSEEVKTVWGTLRQIKKYWRSSKPERVFAQAARRGAERGTEALRSALSEGKAETLKALTNK